MFNSPSSTVGVFCFIMVFITKQIYYEKNNKINGIRIDGGY